MGKLHTTGFIKISEELLKWFWIVDKKEKEIVIQGTITNPDNEEVTLKIVIDTIITPTTEKVFWTLTGKISEETSITIIYSPVAKQATYNLSTKETKGKDFYEETQRNSKNFFEGTVFQDIFKKWPFG